MRRASLIGELSFGIISGSRTYRELIEKLYWRLSDLCQLIMAKPGDQGD
jgi:hypothetical protein